MKRLIKDGARKSKIEPNHLRADTTRPLVEHLRRVSNPTSGLGGDAITRLLQC